MKVAGPVRVMVRPALHEGHDRDFPAGQPRCDVPVVVETDRGDFPGPHDFGPIIFGYPDVCYVQYLPPAALT